MPTFTAPLVETQPVVTGTLYQISLSEENNGAGITRVEIGPYYFGGTPQQVKYPEAPTSELCPADFQSLKWVTDERGASYLRFEGGRVRREDGEVVFQFTSNFPPADDSGAVLTIWRDGRKEDFGRAVPDYTKTPPKLNPRHNSTGLGIVYKQTGCFPQLILGAFGLTALIVALFVR